MACAFSIASNDQNCYPHLMAKETQNSNRLRTLRRRVEMKKASRIFDRLRRTFAWYLSGKVALAILVLTVSATSIVVTTNTYQAEVGGELNVTNNLVAVDKGFSIASSVAIAAGTSCVSPTIFGTGTVANNAITAQHVVYDVAVNETLGATVNTCYTATLVVTPSGGSAMTFGPVYMKSAASLLTTLRIDCEFDIGASAPASPYSFQLTVQ